MAYGVRKERRRRGRKAQLLVLLAISLIAICSVIVIWKVGEFVYDYYARFSRYDELIVKAGQRNNVDPCLIKAVIWKESRFDKRARGLKGEVGLMQIMPSVARQFDVPTEQVSNPETNIWLANKLMSKIMNTLRFPEGTPEKDRMSIILASYNSGIGHVNDARRLARLNGEDPNSWEVVARYLQLKAQPEYYESEAVKCGRFTGSRQTLAYVNDVIGRYDRYCRIAGR